MRALLHPLEVGRSWPGATLLALATSALLSPACSYYTDALLLTGGQGGDGASGNTNGGTAAPSPSGGGGARGGGGAGGRVEQGGAGSASSPGAGAPGAEGGGEGGGGADNESGAGAGGESMTLDACPDDPDKTVPGACGCGVAESCTALKAALRHRYTFEANGAAAPDSIGDADATIVGTTATGGRVVFDGSAAAYVDLPNGTISALTNASFEIWLSWAGGNIWQRIFDFGDNDKAEGTQGIGKTYLYLTPRDGSSVNALRASFSTNGTGAETTVRGAAPLLSGTLQHIVLVVDDTNNELRLYLNGDLAALTGFLRSLSELNDINNWIGRSNYLDTPLGGSIEEVRIYGVALDDAQVAASNTFGPNPAFL